eukprot:scaffold159384_cov18-Tisochrysis_lutea.AAC.2
MQQGKPLWWTVGQSTHVFISQRRRARAYSTGQIFHNRGVHDPAKASQLQLTCHYVQDCKKWQGSTFPTLWNGSPGRQKGVDTH